MTNTRPSGRGSQPFPPRDSRAAQPYGANLPYGFAGERRSAPPPRRPRRSSAGGMLVYGGLALLVLGIGAATFFMLSRPTDLIRREVIARVKAETGRDLSIAGPASFTLLPSPGLSLGDVSLSAPPGMGGEPLVKATSLSVGVRLFPLLSGQIVVDRVVLNEPQLSLRVDADGRRSWDLTRRRADTGSDARLPIRFAATPEGGGVGSLFIGPAAAAQPAPLALDEISVANGAVRYTDERNGAWGRFDGINARFSLAAVDAPLSGSGSFLADGETFQFKSTLTTPGDLAGGRSAKLAISVSGMPLSFTYDGAVGGQSATGKIEANAPSLSALAHWWGSDVSPEAGAGVVAFSANVDASGKGVELNGIDLKAGRSIARGTVKFAERDGARPLVTADLRISGVDLAGLPLGADLRARSGRGRSVPSPSPLSLDAPGAAPAAEPNSIEDLLNRPGPRVKGYTRRAGWGDDPINIKALGLVDAEARLALADVSYGRTRIDGVAATLDLKDEVATLELNQLRLYNGSGQGRITLDASGSDAAFTSDVTLTGIATRPLLRDSAQIDWLDGVADVGWKVSGRGATELALVQSLSGSSRVAVNNGSVIGFDLGGALSQLSEGSVPDFKQDAGKRTTFRSLTGNFAIASGIATNNDLKLDSPHLHATGAGSIDLPQRSLDYTVRPKLVANLAGDNGQQGAAGIEVPVHITGAWQEPKLTPDIAGALNSPGTVDAVKQIGKQLKGKNAGEIVNDLFGKSGDGGPSKAQKLLDGIFGKKQ